MVGFWISQQYIYFFLFCLWLISVLSSKQGPGVEIEDEVAEEELVLDKVIIA